MQLSHRPSQSWEALHQFNGLPVDFNVKSIARTQVQQLQLQHIFLKTSLLLLNTSNLNSGSDAALSRFDFSFNMKHFISLAKLRKKSVTNN